MGDRGELAFDANLEARTVRIEIRSPFSIHATPAELPFDELYALTAKIHLADLASRGAGGVELPAPNGGIIVPP